MEKTTLKLTRKIQLLIDLSTKEEKKEALDKLYQWQNRCFRAANLIVTHLYVQEMIREFFYLSEGKNINWRMKRKMNKESLIVPESTPPIEWYQTGLKAKSPQTYCPI